jgi:hypothetical protein
VLCLVTLDMAWTFWLPEVRNKFALRASWHPQNLPNQDFIAYYTAGLAFRTGHNPYRDNGNIDARLADPGVGGYSRFKYPPAALLFWAFVSRADYEHDVQLDHPACERASGALARKHASRARRHTAARRSARWPRSWPRPSGCTSITRSWRRRSRTG